MPGRAEASPLEARPWLRQYDAGIPAQLDDPAGRLSEALRDTAGRYPDRVALRFYGRGTSYRALDRLVDLVAGGLQRLGLGEGERVALFMPNCPQLVASFFGVWRAGCVVVPVNTRATAAEFARQVSDSGAAAAVVLDRLWMGVRDGPVPSSLRHVVVADIADDLPLVLRIGARITRRDGHHLERLAPPTGRPVVRFGELLARAGQGDLRQARAGLDDPAVLLYTGGTTGLPKAAVLSHRNVVANARQLASWASGLDDGAEVMLSALPLVHGYAMTACMNASILRGWTQILVPDPRDLERLLAEIERWRVTVFPGVPT